MHCQMSHSFKLRISNVTYCDYVEKDFLYSKAALLCGLRQYNV